MKSKKSPYSEEETNFLPHQRNQLNQKPQEPKKVLPHTGETASMALMLGGISVGLLGLGFAKRKE